MKKTLTRTFIMLSLLVAGADLREFVKHMNDALYGRGGGRSGFAQGSVAADEAAIRAFFRGV